LATAIRPPVKSVLRSANQGVEEANRTLARVKRMRPWEVADAKRGIDRALINQKRAPKVVARITAKPYRVKRAGASSVMLAGAGLEAWRRRAQHSRAVRDAQMG